MCEGADQFYPVDAVELSRAKEIMQELKTTKAELTRVLFSFQCGPLSLVEAQRGTSLIGQELHSVATPVSLMP